MKHVQTESRTQRIPSHLLRQFLWTSTDGSKARTYSFYQVAYIFTEAVAFRLIDGYITKHRTMDGGTLEVLSDTNEQEAPEDTPLALDAE